MTFVYDEIWSDGTDFDSTSIDYIYYNRETKEVGIEYQSGTTIYVYDNIEESTAELIATSESVGGAVSSFLTSKRSAVRAEADEAKREGSSDEAIDALISSLNGASRAVGIETQYEDEDEDSADGGRYGVTYLLDGNTYTANIPSAENSDDAIKQVTRLANQIGLYDFKIVAVTLYLV